MDDDMLVLSQTRTASYGLQTGGKACVSPIQAPANTRHKTRAREKEARIR